MGTEPVINNGGDAVGMQLVACGKHKGNSLENGDKSSIQKTEILLVNGVHTYPVDGVRTYKRRKHSQSSSGDMVEHARNSLLETEGHLMDKNSAKEHIGIISDGSCNNSNNQANVQINTELCQHIFSDVIYSEKFDMLCKLLSENFQGIKIESFSDFNIINSRFRDGVYGLSPQLFSEDIQQLWSTLQKIGVEMVSLAKGLSDISRKFCHEQIGGSANGDCVEEKQEDITQAYLGNMACSGMDTTTKQYSTLEPDQHRKPDEADLARSCVCRCCGGKTDSRICIVCDSCEKMYHVFCVGVSVSEDSPRSWYCMNCVSTGLESPHENCVACERVNDPCTKPRIGEDKMDAVINGMLSNVVENSNSQMDADTTVEQLSETTGNCCKLCRCEFDNNQYRECEHSLCRNKFHLRCLSDLELKRFGPRWYCSSCLCRVCLADRDDEHIVLCDGCDNAYHIYCMEPPCVSIPRGKWYCRLCETRLRAIRKAKRVYERKGNTKGGVNTGVYPNVKKDQKKDMAMLLNAVEMVKHEEKLIK